MASSSGARPRAAGAAQAVPDNVGFRAATFASLGLDLRHQRLGQSHGEHPHVWQCNTPLPDTQDKSKSAHNSKTNARRH
jgi:hypothetical protein